ncbi:MAG: helix-turn-helix domain-containing protein [Porphyromonadaceae bacterium]|nr:helix-turn-helix domain-containing protein [Porphyromonadaceae bacterium]
MPKKKYTIELTEKERCELLKMIKCGTSPARVIIRANILLSSDATVGKPLTVIEVAERFNTSSTTVQTVRTDFAQSGLNGALYRKKREIPPIQPKVDGNLEAHIIAICCSNPPKGYERWTLRLVAEKCVELGYVDSISHMTVKRTLKKTNLSLI